MTRRIRCSAGFTLIEVMVVIIILGLLAAIVMPRLVGQTDKARYEQAKIQMRILEDALKRYKLENGHFPTTSQGLQALVQKPSSPPVPRDWPEGGYLDKPEVPADPWGNEYALVVPGVRNRYGVDIVSPGPDGLVGTDDDVGNWRAPRPEQG